MPVPVDPNARPKRLLKALIVILIIGAILLAVVATKIPLPVRLLLAATDLIAAAVLWVAMRQASQK